MRRAWSLAGIAGGLAVGLGCTAPTLPLQDEPCAVWENPGTWKVIVPGYDRRATVFVPPSPGPRAALVGLHGAGGSGSAMRDRISTLQQVARDRGWLAVFPDGSGTFGDHYWNAGSCCGLGTVLNAPDVTYLDRLAVVLREDVCVDRVVAAGQSNGGMMALRWACEGTEVDAAYSSAGPLLTGTCEGDPVPVIETHGSDDAIVPIEGGRGTGDYVAFPSPRKAFQAVVARNACTDAPPTVSTDGATRCETWDCPVPTTFCTLQDWPHRWPGQRQDGGPPGFVAEGAVRSLAEEIPGRPVVDAPAGETGAPGDPADSADSGLTRSGE